MDMCLPSRYDLTMTIRWGRMYIEREGGKGSHRAFNKKKPKTTDNRGVNNKKEKEKFSVDMIN